jgi:hypothetical protein
MYSLQLKNGKGEEVLCYRVLYPVSDPITYLGLNTVADVFDFFLEHFLAGRHSRWDVFEYPIISTFFKRTMT